MTAALSRWLGLGTAGLVLAAAALVGCAAPAVQPVAVPATTASPAPAATAPPAPSGPAPLPSTASVTVTSVTIDAIDLHATRLERLPLASDGSLAAPKDPDRAGWFGDGTLPGDVGPAVIAGHVDSKTGPAVFFDLGRLKRGDRVQVGRSDGHRTTFGVDRVLTTAKKGFPTDAVFGPTPDVQLRLITCGGPYNRTVGSYEDNTIVFATAIG